MLSVSDKAMDVMSQTLEANNIEEGKALRLSRNPTGQFGLEIDEPQGTDQVVTSGERPVLLVDQEISDNLAGAVLDVTESDDGARLTLRLPEPEEA
jgi:Fe-S cluster assembly iron-binding protein IscA